MYDDYYGDYYADSYSGYTGGYYYADPIGVTQMEARSIASVLSGTLKVKVEEGDGWKYDFVAKTIYYRPDDLYSLTERDVTANLLHEAGHAKYSLCPADLKWPDVENKDHQRKLHTITNAIEDFRIEDKLRKGYPYAKTYLPLDSFKTGHELRMLQNAHLDQEQKRSRYLAYCIMVYQGMHSNYTWSTGDKEIDEAVNKTLKFAKKARLTKSTQALANVIGKDIYPHIKKFLDEHNDQLEEEVDLQVVMTKRGPVQSDSEREGQDYEDPFPRVKSLIEPLARKLKNILTDERFDKFSGKYRSGRLNSRRLFRARTGDFAVFERRVERKTKNYVFSILVDKSGSMGGGRLDYAVQGASLFAHVLDKLGIDFGMASFDSRTDHHKYPSQSFTSQMKKDAFKDIYKDCGGGTNDYNAIKEVADGMRGYEGKKVIFVLTDSGGDTAQTKSLISSLERKGFTVVGFGIHVHADDLKRTYNDYVVVRNISDIPGLVATTLKNKLRG